MERNEYDRRQFLKKFGALSSASLLFGATAGCGTESSPDGRALYGPGPVYGPAPVVDPMVAGIYFVDVNSNMFNLYAHQSVPTNSRFVIIFTRGMNNTAPVAMSLMDAGDNAAALNTPIWETTKSFSVTPSAVLLNNTIYTLSLTEATDSAGEKIIINSNATATFKTAA